MTNCMVNYKYRKKKKKRFINKKERTFQMSLVSIKEVRSIGRGIFLATCESCEGKLVKGRFDSNFKHQTVEVLTYHTNGQVCSSNTTYSDTCSQ